MNTTKIVVANADVDDTNGYNEYVTKNFYTNMDAM